MTITDFIEYAKTFSSDLPWGMQTPELATRYAQTMFGDNGFTGNGYNLRPYNIGMWDKITSDYSVGDILVFRQSKQTPFGYNYIVTRIDENDIMYGITINQGKDQVVEQQITTKRMITYGWRFKDQDNE